MAINEALHQLMERDDRVFLMGQGVKSPWYVGNTAKDLLERFGSERVIDTPVSENAVTGAAVGAALAGMRPVVVHPRVDFMLYCMDPIINQAANWYFMNGGRNPARVVFWGIVNRGGEQAAQHSQSLHATFAHVPGLKVVMPASPADAKGLMISAVLDDNPVVFMDDRWLHGLEDVVPEEFYKTPIGKGRVIRKGGDLTVVALSYAVPLVTRVAEQLASEGFDLELIDPRTIKPLDIELMQASVEKTGRLLVLDPGWRSFGVAAEIMASVTERAFASMKVAPERLTLPDTPAPANRELEAAYYLSEGSITEKIRSML
ncbi:MAG: transketolase C-terminal domain-containing protein [Planctomycetota bacterium]